MSSIDVSIEGTGPGAWALAGRLARAGVRVGVASRGGHGANARVMAGYADGPHRLIAGLGEAVTKELMAFSLRGRELLWAIGEGRQAGGLHATMGERESAEAEQAVQAHQLCGDPAELRPGNVPFGPGAFVLGDGVVEVARLLATLRTRALEAGAAETEETGEVRVLAGDWSHRQHEGVLEGALFPVRELSLGMAGGEPFQHALRAQWGYLAAHWHEHLVVTGARWATPHLEVGESTLEVEPRVRAKLLGWARQAFGVDEVLEERVSIETHTCDGLPLVGPMPGDPTTLVCTGFGRDEVPLALASAEALANGLLGEEVVLPSLLRPHRLV